MLPTFDQARALIDAVAVASVPEPGGALATLA
jgi:hypothetical protein